MTSSAARLAGWVMCAAAVSAQTVFRSSIDLIRLDVSVFDGERRLVRGLTQADFTVLEDGKPQPIVAFSTVDLPGPVVNPAAAEWTRSVDPDISTNDHPGRRLIAIVFDDSTFPFTPITLKNAQSIARDIVDKMGPDDLATVIFTRDNRNTRDFTRSRTKLYASIGKVTFGFPPEAYYTWSTLKAIGNIAEYLKAAPEQRKVLVLLSGGVAVNLADQQVPQQASPRGSMAGRAASGSLAIARDRLFDESIKANVNIYAFDVCGLRPMPPSPDPCADSGGAVSSLLGVSNGTGGTATVNTNDFAPGIARVFAENDAYYLLGYRSSHKPDDGSMRRIEVKMSRPDLEARTRGTYEAPSDTAVAKAAAGPADVKALSAILPNADQSLRLAAAPFLVPGKSTSTVALALGVVQPYQNQRIGDEVEVLVKAFTPEGKDVVSTTQSVTIAVPPARRGSDITAYEVLARIDLKPGRYELRASAHSATFDSRGSVYAEAEVPDFSKAPLSLSGVLLSAIPAWPVAPPDALKAIVPVVPTSARTFSRIDRVSAFLRVYQSGGGRPAPVTLTTRITDGSGRTAVENAEAIPAEAFGSTRAVDRSLPLPLIQLVPGEYLFTVEASAAAASGRRDVRFTVK